MVLAIGIIGVAIVWMSRPARGEIDYSKGESLRKADLVEDKQFEGKILGFEYPGKWELRLRQNEETKLGVELVDPAMGGDRIVLSFSPLNGSLGEDTGVKMRRIKTEVYEESEVDWQGNKGLLFKKTDSGEWVWFFERQGKILTVALMSPLNDDEKIDDLAKFVKTIKFY